MIETEQCRGRLSIFDVALRAMQPVGEASTVIHRIAFRIKFIESEFAFSEMVCLLAGFDKPWSHGCAQFQSILHNGDKVWTGTGLSRLSFRLHLTSCFGNPQNLPRDKNALITLLSNQCKRVL